MTECPDIDPAIAKQYGIQEKRVNRYEVDREKALIHLKSEVAKVDLAAAAERIGAVYSNEKLTLKVMGKDFSVDSQGKLFSDIHVNPWVTIPILTYILQCKGVEVKNDWKPLGWWSAEPIATYSGSRINWRRKKPPRNSNSPLAANCGTRGLSLWRHMLPVAWWTKRFWI